MSNINIPILMYHSVESMPKSTVMRSLHVPPRKFKLQMWMLKKLGYKGLSLNKLKPYLDGEKRGKVVGITFDDGYKDHFDYVAPILEQKGIDAAFFPVSDCYENGSLLDVNKIHYIIASVDNDESLLTHLFASMKEEGLAKSDFDNLWNSTNKSSRYDSEVVIFFKRMLQKNLPLEMRQKILTRMFNNLVGRSQKEVSKELYMSKDNLISLSKKGFHIGSHTSSHIWLNSQTDLDQEKEITKSLDALRSIRNNVSNWIMCYPYGGYNAATLSILEKMGCALALTTTIGEADLSCQNKFELKRWDTNDFPH